MNPYTNDLAAALERNAVLIAELQTVKEQGKLEVQETAQEYAKAIDLASDSFNERMKEMEEERDVAQKSRQELQDKLAEALSQNATLRAEKESAQQNAALTGGQNNALRNELERVRQQLRDAEAKRCADTQFSNHLEAEALRDPGSDDSEEYLIQLVSSLDGYAQTVGVRLLSDLCFVRKALRSAVEKAQSRRRRSDEKLWETTRHIADLRSELTDLQEKVRELEDKNAALDQLADPVGVFWDKASVRQDEMDSFDANSKKVLLHLCSKANYLVNQKTIVEKEDELSASQDSVALTAAQKRCEELHSDLDAQATRYDGLRARAEYGTMVVDYLKKITDRARNSRGPSPTIDDAS